MIGIGTDLVEVDRLRVVIQRTPSVVDRLFTPDEQHYANQRDDPTQRYAARFAAKEAVMKAMGIGLGEVRFRDIEVVRAKSGQPSVRLHGAAIDLASAHGVRRWLLTMSHTETMAQAVAVALGDGP